MIEITQTRATSAIEIVAGDQPAIEIAVDSAFTLELVTNDLGGAAVAIVAADRAQASADDAEAWANVAMDAAGANRLQTHIAATNLSGHRAIRVVSDLAYLCDGANAAHVGRCIGMTVGAVVEGAVATIQTVSLISDPGWNWSEGPVYVGANGLLTQSLTGLAFIQQVGQAVSPISIDINPQLPILIS